MTKVFSAQKLQAAMEEIAKVNLEIQKEQFPHKRWERELSKCGCSYRSGAEKVHDRDSNLLPSAHAQMQEFAHKKERDTAILALHDELMQAECMHPDHSRITLSFGLTNSGNPAIDIRFGNISVHERPVTPRTLTPKLIELLDCLSRNHENNGPVRRFMISYTDRITAVSPEQAIWKWLCLRHRSLALDLKEIQPGAQLPDNEEFNRLLAGAAIYEVFDTAPALAKGLSLNCSEEQAAVKDHLW